MPPKAAWIAFETNPDLEFDFYLAEKLGMTVADLRERLSGQEYLQWSVYFSRKANRQKLAQASQQQSRGLKRAGRR